MNIDSIMKELAEYTRMMEEISGHVEGLKDTIKQYMMENGLETLAGNEHKATYKAVTSRRIDTTALKKDMPDIAAAYTTSTTSRRFTFA